MKVYCELTESHIKRVLSEFYHAKIEDVKFNYGTRSVGYGLNEHQEPTLEAFITWEIADDKAKNVFE